MNRISKLSGNYNRVITEGEYEKGKNDCNVFKGLDINNEILDSVLEFKGEAKRVNNKIVNYKLYLFAHKGPGFDSYVVLNNLPQWRMVVILIKNGSDIASLKIFNGYVDPI